MIRQVHASFACFFLQKNIVLRVAVGAGSGVFRRRLLGVGSPGSGYGRRRVPSSLAQASGVWTVLALAMGRCRVPVMNSAGYWVVLLVLAMDGAGSLGRWC